MKRLLLILVLILSSTPAMAEWSAVDSPYQTPGLRTIYIDLTTIRHNGPFVSVSELMEYRLQQGGITGRRFRSAMSQKEFNCPAQKYRFLTYTDFVGSMGTGDARNGIVDFGAWHAIDPESVNQTLWELLCTTP